jgi:adenosylcobinamide-GDP ribazoletransferase
LAFWLALQFLTVFPVPKTGVASPGKLAASLMFFPVVGAIIGLILLAAYWVMSWVLPPAVISVALVIIMAVITGAHHLDGLADSCDGLVSGRTAEERLKIMSGPGIGAFGIVGACLLLLLKVTALNAIAYPLVLLLMPVLGRWVAVLAIYAFPYVRAEGMGAPYKQGIRGYQVAVATVVTLAAAAVLWLEGIIVMVLTGGIACGFAVLIKSRLGGLTGDSYGALIEVTEVAALVLVLLIQGLAGII